MRVSKPAERSSTKIVSPGGSPSKKLRPGWTGVYGSRSHGTSYSAGCFISSMQKHVHVGVFSNPRAAAVAHDAVLVLSGKPPVNCDDAEYASVLVDLCAGMSVEHFVNNIRFPRATRLAKTDGDAQSPTRTMRKMMHALADVFLADRDKPPPTKRHYIRRRASGDDKRPISIPDRQTSDEDTPRPSKRCASGSPPAPAKHQVVKTHKVDLALAKRPRSARLAVLEKEQRVVAVEAAVEGAPAAQDAFAWPDFPPDFNVVNYILFDPDMQGDDHIRMWRHALTRRHLEPFVNSAYAFS